MKSLTIGVDKEQRKITEKEKKDLDKENNCSFCGIDISHSSYYHYKEKWHKSCSLCYYTEHLDKLIAMKKGDLIFMPEISQVELFGIMRVIWYISDIYYNNKQDEHLEEVYDSVMFLNENITDRKDHAETLFSNGVSSVNLIVDYLHEKTDHTDFDKALQYLRWLPNKDLFKEDIDHWNIKDLKKYNPKNFKSLIKHMENSKNG